MKRNAALEAAARQAERVEQALQRIAELPTMDDPDAMCACISDVEQILRG